MNTRFVSVFCRCRARVKAENVVDAEILPEIIWWSGKVWQANAAAVNYINRIVSGSSFIDAAPPIVVDALHEKITKLERIKKKLVRTQLHGHLMKEHLRSNVIQVVLQLRNEPAIFIEDPKYRNNFSCVANQCSRHWMVPGIDTALRHITKLEKEIDDLAKEILEDTALTNAHQALKALEKTSKEFTYIEQKKKLDKLAKDIVKYDKTYTYPYLDEDYYKQDQSGKFVNRADQKENFSRSGSSAGSAVQSAAVELHQIVNPDWFPYGPMRGAIGRSKMDDILHISRHVGQACGLH
ncbi:hypothetical protein NDU88_003157 [Pleurodeles waltl]|uniref:Uncharacterized protein n=1 Tax=Pleurodeles waltl TaxID=8319 RepID=A0AAV7SEQ8_PLEWA|nr:hypothetical protein NDU88_003157 [Pleurodeles waltl]